MRAFLSSHDISLRLTCLYTSQQNGRAERVLRTLNETVRTLLFHASIPPSFWPDALSTATFLLNRRPCRARNNTTPYRILFGQDPDYSLLRTFGCLCYPNTTSTTPNKLSPRSLACVFLGYPVDTKGYRCYDPGSRRVLTSRHVVFDEAVFPFRDSPTAKQQPPASTGLQPDQAIPIPVPVQAPAQNPARRSPAARPARHARRALPPPSPSGPPASPASPATPPPAGSPSAPPPDSSAFPIAGSSDPTVPSPSP